MIFYDTETCGLHGMAVLIQYAEDSGPVKLHHVWTVPVIETLKLIEYFMENDLTGFNLSFDHFHLSKLYTIFSLLDGHAIPEYCIDKIANLEPLGRDGFCIKPKAACDVMLHARKGKFQSTMDRKDIRVRKIPEGIAWEVQDFLEKNVKLDDIYFARKKDRTAPHWAIFPHDEPGFVDIVLKFKASTALKNLAIHALGKNEYDVLKFDQVEPPTYPTEVGYAPFALAISSEAKSWEVKIDKKKGYTWPKHIEQHISHWLLNPLAKRYASDDVLYTREMYEFLGSPKAGDTDSELACMVGSSRWRGYAVDIDKLKALREQVTVRSLSAPKAPSAVKRYLEEVVDPIEADFLSTKKTVLEEVAEWVNDDGSPHPGAIRAKEVLAARQAKSELDLINKLLIAGRFHASFDVIGARSGRMSGRGGDLNPQGIKRENYIRECFPLAFNDRLVGGDFDSFEVVLAITYYGDKKLEEAVKSGKKIHGLFGVHVYPDMTYDQIIADKERYTRSKSAVFAMIYGGEAYTLKTRLGVDLEDAEKAYQTFIKEYPGIGEGRKKVFDMFCSMRQPGGIGTAVKWHEPADSIETMFGFKRYFTLENQICKSLYQLARRPPGEWKRHKGKVTRKDREQTVAGACQSALYAAAFTIQAANMRAAGNHVIQGSGAQITKVVQRKIWDLQPSGIHKWVVQPMNVHDELMCPTSKADEVSKIVKETVDSFKSKVPLISIEWHDNMASWANK